jgi:hypothetical protein
VIDAVHAALHPFVEGTAEEKRKLLPVVAGVVRGVDVVEDEFGVLGRADGEHGALAVGEVGKAGGVDEVSHDGGGITETEVKRQHPASEVRIQDDVKDDVKDDVEDDDKWNGTVRRTVTPG